MKKQTIISLKIATAIISLSLSAPVFAEETADVMRPMPPVRKEIRDERQGLRQDIKAERADFREGVKADIGGMRADIKANREEFRADAKDLRGSASGTAEIKIKREAMIAENKDLRNRTKEEIKTERDVMRENFKKQIEEFKVGRKVKLDEARKTRVKAHLDKAFEKLSAQIANLEGFDAKVELKINQINASGADTAEAETLLVSARVALSDASDAVNAVNEALQSALDSATEISKEAVTSSIQKAVDAIRLAREAYRAVVKALPPKASVDVSATTTVN